MNYRIEFKNKWHIKDFVSQLVFLNQLKRGDTASITFDFNANTIMPQYLAIIVSAINNARLNGIQILFPDYNKHIKQNMLKNKIYHAYAARMDFFKLLGIKYSENFMRRDASGNFVEITQMDIYENPAHPYTQALLSAVPEIGSGTRENRIILKGDIPSPIDLPSGCRFHTRCPRATELCEKEAPPVKDLGGGHTCCCHYCG